MITKLAETDIPYITALIRQVKNFHQLFSKKFTAGFSTIYHRAKQLSVNAEKSLSTY